MTWSKRHHIGAEGGSRGRERAEGARGRRVYSMKGEEARAKMLICRLMRKPNHTPKSLLLSQYI